MSTRTQTVNLPRHSRTALVKREQLNPAENIVPIVFTTGADVLRYDWLEGTYIERLLTGPENVRLDRLNAGAPFLDTHDAWSLGSVIGSVVPGSARMEGGEGVFDVRLSKSARAADTVRDILDGVISNISVGYDVLAFTRTEASDGSPAVMTATDWMPLEVSAVPIPADPGSQISRTRSAAGLELHACQITLSKDHAMHDQDLDERKAGVTWASRILGKALDDKVMARLAPASEPLQVCHDYTPVVIAVQREAVARAFPELAARAVSGRRTA